MDKTILIRMDKKLREQLEYYAQKHDVRLSRMARLAIQKFIEEEMINELEQNKK